MDRWLKERNEAIRNGKFEVATIQGLEKRAKDFVSRRAVKGKNKTIGRAAKGKDFIEFEFEGDPGLEALEKRFDKLTEAAKKRIREYFRK